MQKVANSEKGIVSFGGQVEEINYDKRFPFLHLYILERKFIFIFTFTLNGKTFILFETQQIWY